MPRLSNSQSERIARLKARTIAEFHAKHPGVHDNGRNGTFSSTLLSRLVGASTERVTPVGGGVADDVSGCCCTPLCDWPDTAFAVPVCIPPASSGFCFSDTPNLEESLLAYTGQTITIPSPPVGYTLYNYYFIVYPIVCNADTYTVTATDGSGNDVTGTQYFLGTFESVGQGFSVIFPSVSDIELDIDAIIITASNGCGSKSEPVLLGCFEAGAPVAMANGTTKAIEDVAVGDMVIGAFGEVNPVLALHRPLLGAGRMCRINDEHNTTTHHPHISPDRGFYCPNPEALTSWTYGRDHYVILADGRREKRTMTGVRSDRLKRLEVGMNLQTITGSRTVTSIADIPRSPFTQVYHLVVGGSHTFTVDGYAVVGWAREDDFDYDTWTPK